MYSCYIYLVELLFFAFAYNPIQLHFILVCVIFCIQLYYHKQKHMSTLWTFETQAWEMHVLFLGMNDVPVPQPYCDTECAKHNTISKTNYKYITYMYKSSTTLITFTRWQQIKLQAYYSNCCCWWFN